MAKKRFLIFFLFAIFCITGTTQAHRRFVLTGGPGVGKSTIIAELSKRGYQTTPETFTLLHEQAEKKNTLDTFFDDPAQLRSDLMSEQRRLESSVTATKPAFFDRSTIDIVAFGDYFKVPMSQDLRNQASKNYDLIFFLDPLPEHFYENTAIRRETYKESAEIHNFLKDAYKQLGYKKYQLIDVPYGTPAERTQFILDTIAQTYFYADIIDCFAAKNSLYRVQPFLGPVKLITFKDKAGLPYYFFGVEKDKQTEIPFAKLKAKIAKVMKVRPQNMLEIIGDSAQFSEAGSNYVRKVLREEFSGNHIIEYGFTGYTKGKELDINSFVNEYVDENPTQAYKILANILGHTHMALTQWGTSGSSHVRNFVVVYTQDGMTQEPVYNKEGMKVRGFTTFGDDIIISDHILQAKDGDRMICVEGGVQSFRQVMNALSLNVPVDLIYNVRVAAREPFFSTARFLNQVKDAFVDNQAPSPELVQKIYDAYNATLQSIWDVSKADYLTKKALFETAIQDFINQGIYKRINTLCKFYNASEHSTEVGFKTIAAAQS